MPGVSILHLAIKPPFYMGFPAHEIGFNCSTYLHHSVFRSLWCLLYLSEVSGGGLGSNILFFVIYDLGQWMINVPSGSDMSSFIFFNSD